MKFEKSLVIYPSVSIEEIERLLNLYPEVDHLCFNVENIGNEIKEYLKEIGMRFSYTIHDVKFLARSEEYLFLNENMKIESLKKINIVKNKSKIDVDTLKSLKGCWVLTNPRSGSTFLCNTIDYLGVLLNKSLKEHYNNSLQSRTFIYGHDIECFQAKRRRLYDGKINIIDVSKIHKKNYDNYFLEEDILEIKKYYSHIKFIYLHRRDVEEKAISNYLYNSKERRREFRPYNQEEISKIYKTCVLESNNWDNVLSKIDYLDICFEDLIENPLSKFKEIFEFMKIEIREEDLIESIKRNKPRTKEEEIPVSKEYVSRLKDYNLNYFDKKIIQQKLNRGKT